MNEKIIEITGKAVPLRGDDIDTDRIIPARFMKCLTFDGLGQFAFYDVKYGEKGEEKEHVLNSPDFKGHAILISGRNFGCGSSREHAPWALKGMGIRCIIARSYAEIFANNCSSLGIPALAVDENIADELLKMVEDDPAVDFSIDLLGKRLYSGNRTFPFHIPENYRLALVEGRWDTTSMLMESLEDIERANKRLPAFID
ncbi:MAG: 3-isopropylmalate dehydratase small subunit [Spirochaetales bacterium]|nr:3-isopropylmalate dehydratase small subunit [Spirochaetales bacterium]